MVNVRFAFLAQPRFTIIHSTSIESIGGAWALVNQTDKFPTLTELTAESGEINQNQENKCLKYTVL